MDSLVVRWVFKNFSTEVTIILLSHDIFGVRTH
jgi:hypothetical protein